MLLFVEICDKTHQLSSMQWKLEGQEMLRSAASLDMVCYSNSLILALPDSFFTKMSIDSFLLEADYSILNAEKIVFCIRIGFPRDQNW